MYPSEPDVGARQGWTVFRLENITMKRTKSESMMTAVGIACTAVLLFSTSAIYAQNMTIRGKIAAVKNRELVVATQMRCENCSHRQDGRPSRTTH